jgi:hypothetical protein
MHGKDPKEERILTDQGILGGDFRSNFPDPTDGYVAESKDSDDS